MGRVPQKRQIMVGIGAVIEDNRVLFVKRHAPNIPEYDLKWELPGGKIEMGEAPEAAIEREILEETGLRVTCSNLLPFTFSRKIESEDQELHVIVLCARCWTTTGKAKSVKSAADQEFKWIEISDIKFDNIIPGSKEFLIWELHNLDIFVPDDARLYQIDLEATDEQTNKMRSYRIILSFQPGKKECFEVECQYGRISGSPRIIRESFQRMDQALAYAQQKVRERKQHGYKVIEMDNNHPLRSWVISASMPFKHRLQPRLFDENA